MLGSMIRKAESFASSTYTLREDPLIDLSDDSRNEY
jgi:hypothetical protein